jgi:hypothetical protein
VRRAVLSPKGNFVALVRPILRLASASICTVRFALTLMASAVINGLSLLAFAAQTKQPGS